MANKMESNTFEIGHTDSDWQPGTPYKISNESGDAPACSLTFRTHFIEVLSQMSNYPVKVFLDNNGRGRRNQSSFRETRVQSSHVSNSKFKKLNII